MFVTDYGLDKEQVFELAYEVGAFYNTSDIEGAGDGYFVYLENCNIYVGNKGFSFSSDNLDVDFLYKVGDNVEYLLDFITDKINPLLEDVTA